MKGDDLARTGELLSATSPTIPDPGSRDCCCQREVQTSDCGDHFRAAQVKQELSGNRRVNRGIGVRSDQREGTELTEVTDQTVGSTRSYPYLTAAIGALRSSSYNLVCAASIVFPPSNSTLHQLLLNEARFCMPSAAYPSTPQTISLTFFKITMGIKQLFALVVLCLVAVTMALPSPHDGFVDTPTIRDVGMLYSEADFKGENTFVYEIKAEPGYLPLYVDPLCICGCSLH
jgi:hypothetical protein